jgi:diguanylate cyclase (GGDEF)-like protein
MLAELKLERTNRRLLTELAEKCQELERFAARDLVTGLFNHTHFLGQVGVEVTRSADRQCIVLALISLDRFGQVNRLVGHAGGDAVLQKLAALLVPTGPTNPWGPAGGRFLAGRLQGDTFAVLMPEATRNQAAALLQTLRSSVSEESFGSGLPRLTVSIGLAQYPTDGDTAGLILDSARRALQEAKACGGDTVLAVQPNSGRDSLTDITRVRALGGCIANRAVRFDYQPIVSLSKGGLLAYEALCRPTGNEFRHIGELLDAAGSAGRLVELGGMLRDVALLPIGDLAQDCLLFLNVNPQELNGDALYQADSALWKHARRVVLEITETDEISDFAAAREQLSRLRAAGFRIALDDFGAGYQGFTSLALLEPDFVKLDMGIVRGITAASPAGRLTRHIREFCADEGIATIAEGVETQAEVDALCELGIDLMQGYYFARPSPPFCAATLPPRQFSNVDVPSLGVAKRLGLG